MLTREEELKIKMALEVIKRKVKNSKPGEKANIENILGKLAEILKCPIELLEKNIQPLFKKV